MTARAARIQRRGAIGLAAGLVGSVVLMAMLDRGVTGLLLGPCAGLTFVLVFRPGQRAFADSLAAGATLGLAFWATVSVILIPVVAGDGAQWTATELQRLLPDLVGWITFGAVLGVVSQALIDRWIAAYPTAEDDGSARLAPPRASTRIVILGGGFGGVTTAACLEQDFGADPSVALTLVSETNALLFTPMLAEVAASTLDAAHITSPLRTSLRRTAVIRGRASAIDLDRRILVVPGVTSGESQEVPFDHLVLAVGAVPNYPRSPNVAARAFVFTSLADGIRIRNHVIEMFERADREPDAAVRRALVTFVVAGGGFAGAELAGGLNDFARGMLAYYPNVPPEEVRILLVHSRERILPALSERLAAYALERMAARGVEFKLHTRVNDAQPGLVVLDPVEEIPTETLIWTAGTRPNPLLEDLPVPRDRRGAVVVDGTLAVPGHPGLWALGDCAAVPNAATGTTSPATAQFALRQAKSLARNLHASVVGQPLVPFRFKEIGLLCVVGHHTACAEIRGRCFSGFVAWLMWRAIYLAKLPGLERKAHVLADWAIELFFPRDIVQTTGVARESD